MSEVKAKYQPSSGTDGEMFMNSFCDQCKHDENYTGFGDGCEILVSTMLFDVDDDEYPAEWIRDEKGARCTAFEPK